MNPRRHLGVRIGKRLEDAHLEAGFAVYLGGDSRAWLALARQKHGGVGQAYVRDRAQCCGCD